MKPSQSEFVPSAGCATTAAAGRRARAELFMLHGWMDVSASFQFLVDALRGDWRGSLRTGAVSGSPSGRGRTALVSGLPRRLDRLARAFQPENRASPERSRASRRAARPPGTGNEADTSIQPCSMKSFGARSSPARQW